MKKYFISGGAGFIGSHLAEAILNEQSDSQIVIYDNFSSGSLLQIKGIKEDRRVAVKNCDIKDKDALVKEMQGADIVYHLASNPDIAKAAVQPDIDFWEGTYLTNNILEAMRINEVKKILYASGSGVYGDAGLKEVDENYSPLTPVSTYGASKLACEALICAYCHMFDMSAAALRFANVVGPRQTHGVGLDFVRKLLKNNSELEILGDGSQSKSYVYINDCISAFRLLENNSPQGFSCYNIATLDYITVREIADITVETMGLKNVEYKYTGGQRGWKGDVPVIRLDSRKIRELGWKNRFTSSEAVRESVRLIYEEAV